MQKSLITLTDKLKLEAVSSSDHTLISIKPPKQLDGVTRTPTDVCAVIDVSGSMGSEAKIKTDPGKSEGFGFTTLDLVKHALATIVESLGPDDRLSLVSFSSTAKVELELTYMDQNGKKKAMKACNELDPDGSTNLWGGLSKGLDLLRDSGARVNSAILLLTDGQPNIEPPRGHGPSLKKYKADKGLPGHIHYFGFGYEMNSELLNELAGIGNGAYSFIPDGGFVGTIFINALANLLTTVASKVTLKIDLESGCKIDENSPMLSFFNHSFNSGKSLEIDLGTVGFGQDRNIILPITHTSAKTLNLELSYDTMFNEERMTITQEILVEDADKQLMENQTCRLQTICELSKAITLGNKDSRDEATKNIEKFIHSLSEKDGKYIQDIIIDLKEQVLLALSKEEFYKKWGSHYFYSLMRAHILQQRNNFKDPGVQHYRAELFES
jgi:hypothetical protein